MKTFLKTLFFVALAAVGVPASAAPEKHEEFARQYMPESQAVFERFRKDCAETQKLRESLAEDLRVMNRLPEDDAGYCAVSETISALMSREAEWTSLIKDAYFKHKAGMATSEQLAAKDSDLAKSSIAWENDVLKNLIKTSIAEFGVPATVKIPGKRYAFGKYEVTQKEYEKVMGANPSNFKGRNLPVEQVSWHDAVTFCEKLTARERALGRISEDEEYRLPTSDEWEHACRAGTTTWFYTGDAESDLDRAGWYRDNSGEKTHPVGQKEPNAFGLYDMHGNVWEWTSTAPGASRVLRGGGWCDGAGYCGSSRSGGNSPDDRNDFLGFRVVLDKVQ